MFTPLMKISDVPPSMNPHVGQGVPYLLRRAANVVDKQCVVPQFDGQDRL